MKFTGSLRRRSSRYRRDDGPKDFWCWIGWHRWRQWMYNGPMGFWRRKCSECGTEEYYP